MSEATDAERLIREARGRAIPLSNADYDWMPTDLSERDAIVKFRRQQAYEASESIHSLADALQAALAREQAAIKERDAEYERANRLNQTAIEQSTEATTYAAANAKLTKERDEILEREKAYVSSALNVKLELAKLTEENRVLADKLRVAVEALEFYALEGHWQEDVVDAGGRPMNVPFSSAIDGDRGDIAQTAITALSARTGDNKLS